MPNTIILWIIRFLNQLYQKNLQYYKRPNPHQYEALTPIDDADHVHHYSDALEYALDQKDVTNIAVSGSFGSGKSSFLRTFERNHIEWDYLNISLATFKDDLEEDLKLTEQDVHAKNQLIERSILQQMFYKVEKRSIPRSRFKRIQNISTSQILKYSIIFCLWGITCTLIFKPELANKFLVFNHLNLLNVIGYSAFKTIYSFFVVLIAVITSFYFVYLVVQFLANMNISKFNFKKGEIEVSGTEEASILNEYIDEILYFFEVTRYNIVVIEDLDRFKNTEVFVKLREINELINKSDQIAEKVVFIYAIKDDMFNDEGRTKFFDFMIPIIPYINSSNSYDKLIEKFGEDYFDKELVNYISFYIDDMRLLKNIYNEYRTYDNNIGSEGLNHNKLLAMIVYKNLNPSDFAKLHANKGILYSAFINKPKYKANLIKEIDSKIELLKSRAIHLESESVDRKTELRSIYIYEILKKLNFAQHLKINNEAISPSQLEQDEFFDKLLKHGNFGHNNHYQNNEFLFSDLEKSVNPDLSYTQREKLVNGLKDKAVQSVKIEIEELQREKQSINSYTLEEILVKFESSDEFDKNINGDDLLKYLLKRGYINETYHTYISYFFEGSITKIDKEFLLSVSNEKELGFEYELIKIEELLEKLPDREFESHSILNYSLLDYLIAHRDGYTNKLKNIISQLPDGTEISTNFIDQFFEFTAQKEPFIQELAKAWPDFWEFVDKDSGFSVRKKNMYLSHILKGLDINEIIELNGGNALTDHISEEPDFFGLVSDIDSSKVCSILKALDIKFIALKDFSDNKKLQEYIYNNEHYQINELMINHIIAFKMGLTDDLMSMLKSAHLTTIHNLNLSGLSNYIDKNIGLYVSNILLKIDDNTNESVETVIGLLNHNDLDFELCQRVIKKEQVRISEITDVKSEDLWGDLLESDSIIPNWENLLDYYQLVAEIDVKLADYLNKESHYKILSKEKIDGVEKFDKKWFSAISEKILLSNEIQDISYTYLLKSVPYWYPSLDTTELTPVKINALITHKKLQLTQDNINYLVDSGSNKQIDLIENFLDIFLSEDNSFDISTTTYIGLIKSKNISTEDKSAIIDSINIDLIRDDELLLQVIYDFNLSHSYQLHSLLFEELMSSDRESLNDKVLLLSNQIQYLDDENITRYLQECGKPYNLILKNGTRPSIKKTDANEKLVKELHACGYISSYSNEAFKKIRINTKHS